MNQEYTFKKVQTVGTGKMAGLERLDEVSAGDSLVFDPTSYHSQEAVETEWQKLWKKVWVIAGRLSDIEDVGDYFTYELGRETFIIVRSGKDQVKAFFNVCQHRGNQLVTNEYGSLPDGFTCGFHSWQFNLDGTLKNISDKETFRPEVICDDLDLIEVRCDQWGGFVFITLSDDAPPLREYLDHIPDHLKNYRVEDMKVVKSVRTEWPSNWKTAVDAFTEGYHVHALHVEVLDVMDDKNVDVELYNNGMSLMQARFGTISPRLSDQSTINEALGMMLREVGIDPDEYGGSAGDVRRTVHETRRSQLESEGHSVPFTDAQLTDDQACFIFPCVALNTHPEGALFMQFLPHPSDPDRFFFNVDILIHPVDDDDHALPFYMGIPKGTDLSCKERPEPIHLPLASKGLGIVLDQDSAFLPTVQKGIASAGFKGMRFSEQEIRLRYIHEEIGRYLRDEKW